MIGTRSALFDPELPATDRGTLSEPPNLTMPEQAPQSSDSISGFG
jgi:hypothetical protein